MNIFIRQAKIILDESILEGDLSIINGTISAFNTELNPPNDAIIIEAKGKYLSPAFFDIHTHGTCGADFSSGKIEDFEIIAKQKLSEGVSHILPTSLCMPIDGLKKFMQTAKEYASQNKYAKIEAVHLEGSFIATEMCGAQNKEYCRACNLEEIDALSKIFKIAKISYSLEQDLQSNFVKALIDRNIVPSLAHSNANFKQVESAYNLGLRNITHFFNRCSPMTHRDLGVVGAGLYFQDIYLELILDLVHVDKKALELVLNIKDKSKLIAITDSILIANMPESVYDMAGVKVSLKDNVAKIYGTDNLAGSTLKMNDSLKNLVEELGLSLPLAVKLLSENPAKSLNMQSNAIATGSLANLTLFNEAFKVSLTIVDGLIKYKNL
ncbi:MAG: N-acetylglucosamine-6-phosphate deacetylase [Opitutales bacterium]